MKNINLFAFPQLKILTVINKQAVVSLTLPVVDVEFRVRPMERMKKSRGS